MRECAIIADCMNIRFLCYVIVYCIMYAVVVCLYIMVAMGCNYMSVEMVYCGRYSEKCGIIRNSSTLPTHRHTVNVLHNWDVVFLIVVRLQLYIYPPIFFFITQYILHIAMWCEWFTLVLVSYPHQYIFNADTSYTSVEDSTHRTTKYPHVRWNWKSAAMHPFSGFYIEFNIM